MCSKFHSQELRLTAAWMGSTVGLSEVTPDGGVQEDASVKPCSPGDPESPEVHSLRASVLRRNQVEWGEDAQRYLSLFSDLREAALRFHIHLGDCVFQN